ncbi:MAG: GNAT family N-acetyltransferase [Xanthobacteraceae bacterium]
MEAGLPLLRTISHPNWLALAERANEPNGYFLPDWALAVDASARERAHVSALRARTEQNELIGLLPVVSTWRAWRLPLPALVSADPYGDLGSALLDGRMPQLAAKTLLAQARDAGARAIVLRFATLEGSSYEALKEALAEEGLKPHVLRAEARASLDATKDAETLLRDALGAKKLKELRRQHNRLADFGEVNFSIAKTPGEVRDAVEVMLELEARGWKASRGTALAQHEGDAAFIRRASVALAAHRQCEIAVLAAGERPVAAGVVLRHHDRAFWFKLGIDERLAKYSPGVQLALALTRHFCADPDIRLVDSTARPGHPMIDPIWRGRLPIGDVVIPLYRNDPVAGALIAALRLRMQIRSIARDTVKTIRALKEKWS